jgi:hypothetical protein
VLPPSETAAIGRRGNLITLESRGVRVEVGRFVNEAKRRQVARELRQALRQVSVIHKALPAFLTLTRVSALLHSHGEGTDVSIFASFA